MTAVAAANADPSRRIVRGRQANADAVPPTADQTGSSSSFAAMLATSRQSSAWLDGVLDRRVDQIAASYRRHQRVQQALTADNSGALAAVTRLSGQSASRTEMLQSAQADSTTKTRRSSKDRPDRTQASSTDQSERSARTPRSDRGENRRTQPVVETKPHQMQAADGDVDHAAPAVRSGEALGAGSSVGQPAACGATTNAAGPQSATAEIMGVTAKALPTQPVSGVPAQPVMGQVATANGAQAVQAVTTPAGGGTQEQGTSLGRPTVASGPLGESSAGGKGGGSSVDFQSTLQQVSRARQETMSPRAAEAGTAKRENAEVLKPSSAESVQQLARIVRSNVNARHASLVLRLDPPELGQVRVDVRMHDQLVSVRIEAETRHGMDALQTRLAELKHALEQQGVQIDRLEIGHRSSAMPHAGQQENGPGSQGDARGEQGAFNAPAGQGGQSQDARNPTFSREGHREEGLEPVGSIVEIIDSGSVRSAETGVDLLV